MVIDEYQNKMQIIYENLGGDPTDVPSPDCMDAQGWWWHEIFIILGGDPSLEPPDDCADIFGFWLQQIYMGFGGDPAAWPPENQYDKWGWWFQQICTTLGSDPSIWPPEDEMDCLSWWLDLLIELTVGGGTSPLRFYQKDGDLYVNVTQAGTDLGISQDDFSINANGELVSDTPIDNDLSRVGDDVEWDDGSA
jgi:hypothetical protein